MKLLKIHKRRLVLLAFVLLVCFSLSLPACLAQNSPADSLNQTRNASELPAGDVPSYLGQIIGIALSLSGSIFLLLVIYGGFLIMTSGGNQERYDKGRKTIYWAVVGILLIGASYAITSFIFNAILQ